MQAELRTYTHGCWQHIRDHVRSLVDEGASERRPQEASNYNEFVLQLGTTYGCA